MLSYLTQKKLPPCENSVAIYAIFGRNGALTNMFQYIALTPVPKCQMNIAIFISI